MISIDDDRRRPHQRLAALVAHEAAGDDVGHAFDRAGLPVDGDDRHDQAVGGEVLAIAHHLVGNLAGAVPSMKHAAGRHALADVARRCASNRMRSPFSTTITSVAPLVTRSATRAWRVSWRYSPCTGMK